MSRHKLPHLLLLIISLVFAWSVMNPHDLGTWFAEVAPVIIAVPLLIVTSKKFPLTSLAYILITIHCIILMVGGHYTYALTPIGDWMRDVLNTERNPYDRLGHLAQGFIPAIIIRELLIRTSPLKAGKWLTAIIIFCCLGISALYEIIEWAAAISAGSAADGFLGAQGDIWDTDADMLCAGIGAGTALLTLSRLHDKQLAKL